MAKTVDNLGIQTSIQYAAGLDNPYIDKLKDASNAVRQSEVDTISSTFTSELGTLFGTDKRGMAYAGFTPPLRYDEQKKRLFTQQVIPFFGNPEKKELQVQRIQAIETSAPADSTTKRESAILLNFLNTLTDLDECLQEIINSRSQYQKG